MALRNIRVEFGQAQEASHTQTDMGDGHCSPGRSFSRTYALELSRVETCAHGESVRRGCPTLFVGMYTEEDGKGKGWSSLARIHGCGCELHVTPP